MKFVQNNNNKKTLDWKKDLKRKEIKLQKNLIWNWKKNFESET